MNSQQIEQFIDNILVYLGCSDTHAMGRSSFNRISKDLFDGAIPFDPSFDLAARVEWLEKPNWECTINALHAHLNEHFDIRVLNFENIGKYDFQVQRIREIRPKEARGKVTRVYPTMVRRDAGLADANKGIITTFTNFYGYLGNEKWVNVTNSTFKAFVDNTDAISCFIGVQYSMFWEWQVYIAYNDSPGIVLFTDPIGAREFFRLRDIPEGKQRRTALKHWVREHYRKNRSHEIEEMTKVRKHLRGNQSFTWNGLHCEIRPSKFDLAENERLKQAR